MKRELSLANHSRGQPKSFYYHMFVHMLLGGRNYKSSGTLVEEESLVGRGRCRVHFPVGHSTCAGFTFLWYSYVWDFFVHATLLVLEVSDLGGINICGFSAEVLQNFKLLTALRVKKIFYFRHTFKWSISAITRICGYKTPIS